MPESQLLTMALAQRAEYVDWNLADPKGRPVDDGRAIRDEIERRVRSLVDELDRA